MGSLGLNKKYIISINASSVAVDSYIFLSGSNNTFATFLSDAETTFGASGVGTEIIIYDPINQIFTIYLRRTSTSWRDPNNIIVNNTIINSGTIFYIRNPAITRNFTMQGTNLIQKYSNLGTTSIKKQNQTILKPYSIDGGATAYDANAVYIFKGGTTNTISTVFNYLELTGGNTFTADFIIINSDIYYYKTSGIGGTGWRNTLSTSSDASNTVINPNDIISFAPRSYKEINIGSGVIVQKLYSGKLNLN